MGGGEDTKAHHQHRGTCRRGDTEIQYICMNRQKWIGPLEISQVVKSMRIGYQTNKDRRTIGAINHYYDLTESESAKEYLLFSRTAIESTQEALIAFDTGYIINYWNCMSERIYSIQASEAIGRKLSDIIEVVKAATSKNGDIFAKLESQGYYKGEQLHRTRNAEVWVSLNVQVIEADGKHYGYVLHALDISERKRLQESLNSKTEELSNILDHVPAYVFYKDMECRHVFVNSAMTKLTGIPANDWLGKTCHDMFPNLNVKYDDDDKEVISRRSPLLGVIGPISTPRGIRWLKTDKIPHRGSNGEVDGILGLSVDITDNVQSKNRARLFQRRLRSLLKRLASTEDHERQQLAEGLHEGISQVLALIRISLIRLTQNVSPREISRCLKQITCLVDEAIENTSALVFGLSDAILHEQQSFEAALEHLVSEYNETGTIQYSLKIIGNGNVLGNELGSFLFRTVRELMNNALKHSQAGKVEVSVNIDNSKVQLVVKDDGIGFNSHNIDTKHQCFGLFNIREKLKAIGGQFNLEPSAGKGTCITIVVRLDSEPR